MDEEPRWNRSSWTCVALQLYSTTTNAPEVVWPGVVVWPDWFNPKTAAYWTNEFALFFNPATGIDIDGAWIDMNDPASFCTYPCADPYAEAVKQGLPPNRTSPPPQSTLPLPIDASDTQVIAHLIQRDTPGSNYSNVLTPPYAIANAAGNLSDRTAFTDVIHSNGLIEYDTREYHLILRLLALTEQNQTISLEP
jgi:alpha-glucosidase